MSREIKFRFVFKHEDTGEIKFHACTLDDLLERPLEENCHHLEISYLLDAGYKLIAKDQYTGLCDNNKQEIYDRDILQLPRKEFIAKVVWVKETTKFCLEARSSFCESGWMELVYAISFAYNGEAVKIIGNEHQNPELLNN